jgi:hypothetical protein
MEEKKQILIKNISEVNEALPINYQKAKLTFHENMPIQKMASLKFIEIGKYQTKKATVRPFYKPISKII